MKAVRKHTDNPWALLYIERWLTAPLQQGDGRLLERLQGTPQGGVISPLLSNLFLHYVFDVWMKKHFPTRSGVGMPTMDWCIVTVRFRQKAFWRSWKYAFRSVGLSFTHRKPRSSTARMANGKARMRTHLLTFWVTPLNDGYARTIGITVSLLALLLLSAKPIRRPCDVKFANCESECVLT